MVGRIVDALALTCHSYECHVVVFLEGGMTKLGVDKCTAESDIGGA